MYLLGTLLVVVGSGLGLAVSIYNYFSQTGFLSPLSNTAGTPGALLVIGSTTLMLLAGLAIMAWPKARTVALVLRAAILLAIFGTGLAALLLESPPLLGAMAVAAAGWVAMLLGRSRRAIPA